MEPSVYHASATAGGDLSCQVGRCDGLPYLIARFPSKAAGHPKDESDLVDRYARALAGSERARSLARELLVGRRPDLVARVSSAMSWGGTPGVQAPPGEV